MDGYSPRFQRQSSCSCAPSMSRASRGFVRGGFYVAGDDDFDADDHPAGGRPAGRSAGTRLRGLWRRIVREKNKILCCTTGAGAGVAPLASHGPYDEHSYAQNFDDGAAWVEPENLSRSFSARFAVPSRVLQRVAA